MSRPESHRRYRFLLDESCNPEWEMEVFQGFHGHLLSTGLDVIRRSVRHFETRDETGRSGSVTLSHFLGILQRCDGGDYWALDVHDFALPTIGHIQAFLADPRCRGVLKCQWRQGLYSEAPWSRVLPWSYFEDQPLRFQRQLVRLRSERRVRDDRRPLFFRGNPKWCNRGPITEALIRRRLLNEEPGKFIDYDDYLQELISSRLALCLPGMGNLCHREIEAFGVGVPVLMPPLINQTHEPLLPDHHYLAVDVDPEEDPLGEVVDKIEARFHEVIDDDALLAETAARAMAWYERNVRFPSAFELGARCLGLEIPARREPGLETATATTRMRPS